MVELASSEARKDFAETLRRASAGERFVLTSHGKGVAAIVPIEDLEMLQMIEDRLDARATREALAEVEREGTVPWDQVKAELGL
jgi:prevent-host-death family protein